MWLIDLKQTNCVKRPFIPTFINEYSLTKLNYFICQIDLPDTITLYREIIEMFNPINLNIKYYAEKSDDDIGIPTNYRI